MSNGNHNNIIKKAAKEALSPYGMFQQGQSRTWIDDNGWYLTVIEFQPSAWAKASYLNVGIHFLWSDYEHITFDLGYRIKNAKNQSLYIEYQNNDEQFYEQAMNLAKTALDKAIQYRKFSNLSYAKKNLLSHKFERKPNGNYIKLMFCILTEDMKKANKYFKAYKKTLNSDPDSNEVIKAKIKWFESVFISPLKGREQILESIIKQRLFHKQHSMKNLSDTKDIFI